MPSPSLGKKAAVIGASGAIGHAFVQELVKQGFDHIDAFSRTNFSFRSSSRSSSTAEDANAASISLNNYKIDITDENSISEAVSKAKEHSSSAYNLIFVASGILHLHDISPEKSLKSITLTKLESIFSVNTFGPILLAKHFIPRLNHSARSVFAVLSARVGSVSDNRLGGWYSYRASKAALNMLIKTLSIELQRTNPNAIIVSLHPGTVDSPLSLPFQTRVPKEKLFLPEKSAAHLYEVIQNLTSDDTGKIFAWDGSEITP